MPEKIVVQIKEEDRRDFYEGKPCHENGAVATIIDYYLYHTTYTTWVVETNFWTKVKVQKVLKKNSK